MPWTGRQNDKYGNIAPWWTQDTLSQYLSRTRCFTEEFHNYVVLNGTRVRNRSYLSSMANECDFLEHFFVS